MAVSNPLPGILMVDDETPVNRRAMSRRAMAGREPTAKELAWLRARLPEQNEAVYRLADTLTPFPAMAEAYNDPSIANVTRAGIQTAATVGKPLAALGALGLGYGTAAAKDAGILDMGANAQTAAQSRARAQEATAKAKAEEGILKAKTEAERQAAEIEAKRKADALAADKATSDKAEYDAAVGKASLIRDEELKARRSKPFAETEVGKLYDKTGIATPFLLAAGLSGLTRAGSGGGSKLKDYGIPVAEGALTGVATANWPLGHELIFQPSENPEKAAYRAFARELPPTHPRKQEWSTYAENLPDANPARTTAAKEFYDPVKFAERSGIGLIEGIAGGLAGPAAWRAGSRLGPMATKSVGDTVEGLGTLPGRGVKGYNRGMTDAVDAGGDLVAARNRVAAMPPPAPRPPQLVEPPPAPVQASQGILNLPAPAPAAKPPVEPPNWPATKRPAKSGRFNDDLYAAGPGILVAGGAGADAQNDPNMLAMLVQAGILPPSVLSR